MRTELRPFRRHVDRAGVHPNGPAVLILNRDDGIEDRVHWWRKDHLLWWSNRHNHRWSFESECWHGELEEDLIEVEGEGGLRNNINGVWDDLGPVSWSTTEIRRVRPGPSRRLELEQFHRVRAIEETITYVRTDPIARNWSRVLPNLHGEHTSTGLFVPFGDHEVQEMLDRIEDILQ